MNWEEVCKWVWKTDRGNEFQVKIDGEYVYYQLNDWGWAYWCSLTADVEYLMRNYTKVRPIVEFCGPMQPPPSKVILKIRQMEQRQTWKKSLA